MTEGGYRSTIYQQPVELLQQLIRFDTTNPPGNEADCIGYIDRLLTSAGIKTTILAGNPARPNLVARLPGRGSAPPLLLYAHIDVVSTENQPWQHPPFEGKVIDGYVWGRGAIDDKGGAAMSLCAFMRAKAEDTSLPGDVVLAILCDEETGGEYGARYLVENHPDKFAGITYAIGETGGFTFYIDGHKFYPIMVAEKTYCVLQAVVRGPAVHGYTTVVRGGAAARLGALLTRLDKAHLPVHVIPIVRKMFQTISSSVTFPGNLILRQLLRPKLTDIVLDFLGPRGHSLYPLLHNTLNVTRVHGGEQVAGTPAKISADMIAALLPGYGPEDLLAELRPITGDDVELEVIQLGEIGPKAPNMGLYDTLSGILREADPEGVPMPMLFTSPTDARHFAQLGIQTYGFQPMKLPPNMDIAKLAHGADERIPVEALEFGANAIYKTLQRFSE
jgi:acetylornithine deacetylase/succinyl-diaminopimelate desuccinylase-like protein